MTKALEELGKGEGTLFKKGLTLFDYCEIITAITGFRIDF